MTKHLSIALLTMTVLTSTLILFRQNVERLPNSVYHKAKRVKNSKASDFDKAVIDEFNLLKNPTTGIIPSNAHELEMKEAKEIVEKQLLDGPQSSTTATSYVLQGPTNLGGRVRSIEFDLNDPTGNTILAGSVSGALFRTTNGGANWTRQSPASERFSVTSIAQDPRVGFRNIWYYSTGEALGNSASEAGAFYAGSGVFKSIDNGLSWARLPNSNTGSLFSFDRCSDIISQLIVDPTTGDVYGANAAQIMRSTDGGANWSVVLGSGSCSSTMVGDLIVTSTGIIYAALAGNTPTNFDGVWTSTDGTSWTRIAGVGVVGSPAGWNAANSYGRVVLANAPSNENLVYALYHNNISSDCSTPEAELFRYDNGTGAWVDLSATLPNETGCLAGNDPFAVQGGYDLEISVKPNDPNTIFVAGTNAYRSTNAGVNWTRIGGYANAASYGRYTNHHPDVHALKFNPANSNLLITGSDGGIHVADISQPTPAWTSLNNNLITYQYYHVAIKPETGINDFLGGAQDNGTTTVIGGGNSFSEILGGDGVAVGLASGTAPYTQFCGFQQGPIYRRLSSFGNGFISADLTPPGLTGPTPTYSTNFVTYFFLDPDNTNHLYYSCVLVAGSSNRIQRLTNATTASNTNWTLMDFGYNGYVRAMATTRGAYTTASRLYLGTSTGRVYRMVDPRNAPASTVPDNITPPSITPGVTILGIAVNPTNHNELMVVCSNYGVVNIWYTNNAGDASPIWINAEGNLTAPSTRTCMIVQDGANTEYYVGTSIGLYKTSSMSGSIVWTQEAINDIGFAPVVSLALRPSDNIFAIGTHGLGMWRGQAGAVLPVNLISFDGALLNKNAKLSWRTENELNNKGFELQRSYDGNNFKTIGFIPSAASSSGNGSYGFNDPELAQSFNYYRLKQIDVDGSFQFSNVVLLKANIGNDLKVLNNPFNSYIDIQLSTAFAPSSVVQLMDASGRLVSQQILMPNLLRQRMNVRSNLANGVYYLKVIAGKQQFVTTVLKQ